MKNLLTTTSLFLYTLFSVRMAYAAAETINLTPPAGSVGPGEIQLTKVPQFLITILFVTGLIIAVVFLIYGGIKWILSGGDKTHVESARNHIVAAIVGMVVIAAAFFIISVVFTLLGVDNPLSGGKFCLPTLKDPQC